MSVVVPVRDAARSLLACLDALRHQRLDEPFEVVVVDNASTDGSAEVARSHPLGVRVAAEPRPGAYAARNAGITASRGSVLAFTDADCRPAPGWLAAGLASVRGGADLVGGDIRAERSAQPTVWERYDRALYLRQQDLVVHQRFAATANLFVRREVIEAVGPFDPDLRSSGDLEFCHRAVHHGFTLVHAPDAVVRHRPRRSLAGTWALHRRLGAGWAALARRGLRGPVWADPALRLPLGMVVRAVGADGPPLRRRHLAPVHAVAMLARLVGRLTGR